MMSQMRRERASAKALCKLNNTKQDKEPEDNFEGAGGDPGTLKEAKKKALKKILGIRKGA